MDLDGGSECLDELEDVPWNATLELDDVNVTNSSRRQPGAQAGQNGHREALGMKLISDGLSDSAGGDQQLIFHGEHESTVRRRLVSDARVALGSHREGFHCETSSFTGGSFQMTTGCLPTPGTSVAAQL
jgi:hypothetical protein